MQVLLTYKLWYSFYLMEDSGFSQIDTTLQVYHPSYFIVLCVHACARSAAQSCPSLCDPMNYRPPGSSAHKSSLVRILVWVAIFYSTGIFLAQGKNPHLLRLLHWQADSLSPCHLADDFKQIIEYLLFLLFYLHMTVFWVL